MIYLVRHAAHAHLGDTLSGRMAGIALSEAGAHQARALATKLAPCRFAAIHTSPIQRAMETAEMIAADRNAPLSVHEALDEIDFGNWTGRRFADLEDDADWSAWNRSRGSARAADGETMTEAQARIVAHIQVVARQFPEKGVVIISHCDVLRAALAHYLALPLGKILNFDIDPASVSRLAVGEWGGRVLSMNEGSA